MKRVSRLRGVRFVWMVIAVMSMVATGKRRIEGEQPEYRWIYLQQNLQVAENIPKIEVVLRRASAAGYNGVVLADYKLNILDRVPDHYFVNAEKFRDLCRELHLEVVPAIGGFGYSSGILAHDPNLAEGLPVRGAPFIVRDGAAHSTGDVNNMLPGEFEKFQDHAFAGWGFQDEPGAGTYVDQDVRHGGHASLRIENPPSVRANRRVSKTLKVRPWAQYHASVWIRAHQFRSASDVRMFAMSPGGRVLSHSNLGVRPDQDWTEHHVVFNSLENDELRFYVGVWDGGDGRLWLDDLRLVEEPFVNLVRRPGCPFAVRSDDGSIVYEEGRDYEPFRDTRMGVTPWPGEFDVYHEPPTLRLTTGSAIHNGDRIRVDYHHAVTIYDGQVPCSLTEPKVFEIVTDQITRVNKLFRPRTLFFSHDEIRVANWSQPERDSGRTAGEQLAANVARCVEIAKAIAPDVKLCIWSDMFDPFHNARDDFYLVNGDLAGSWNGLPRDMLVVNWNSGKPDKSLPFFSERGHDQILAGYYDGPADSIRSWMAKAREVQGPRGVMYTTWRGDFSQLEAFARSAWGGSQPTLTLTDQERVKCTEALVAGFASDEFWPSMHAAEALTQNGYADMVREKLERLAPNEHDDQRRCGIAREIVRAGDLSRTQIMLDILAGDDSYGHTHACESLFKVWQIGNGELLREAMERTDNPKALLMAAAALARWGSPAGLARIRPYVAHEDWDVARIAAWVLARTGDDRDLPALRTGRDKAPDALTRAYFEHALAALGDPDGLAALTRNLESPDPAVRTYACEFAPDSRAFAAKGRLLELLEDEGLDVRIRAAQALLLLSRTAARNDEPFAVDVFKASVENPRISEGSVIVLRDGRLLYATTMFQGNGSDAAAAHIVATESLDGGRTWGGHRILQENIGRQNVMSVTLRRLSFPPRHDAPIGFFYLVKNSPSDLDLYMRTSIDEGHTWTEPVLVTDAPGYHVMNNDRVTVLSTGRLVVPVSTTSDIDSANHFQCACFLSDDWGRTWHSSRNAVDYSQRGAMEPEVLELADGRLLMHFRTQLGHIAVSESADNGENWSAAASWNVRAPEAPSTLRRIPSTNDLVLIWNDTFVAGASHGGQRTPLTVAISTDEGRTWSHQHNIETDMERTFAYSSIAFDRGSMLMTYYVGDRSGRISSRFRSIPIRELYRAHSE